MWLPAHLVTQGVVSRGARSLEAAAQRSEAEANRPPRHPLRPSARRRAVHAGIYSPPAARRLPGAVVRGGGAGAGCHVTVARRWVAAGPPGWRSGPARGAGRAGGAAPGGRAGGGWARALVRDTPVGACVAAGGVSVPGDRGRGGGVTRGGGRAVGRARCPACVSVPAPWGSVCALCARAPGRATRGDGVFCAHGGCMRGVTGRVCRRVIQDTAGARDAPARTRVAAVLVCAWYRGSAGGARGTSPAAWAGAAACVQHPGHGWKGTWGQPARKQSPPVLGGDRRFQSVPAAPGLVPRGEEAHGGVGCQSSMWPSPTQDQCIALLPVLAKFLAARGAVTATDVCPQYLMLCRHHVGTATLHEQLPSLCFAHLVLKGEAIAP